MTTRQAVLDAMRRDIGQESEPGEWFTVTQQLIDDYVDLTGETGWIHTDVERSKQSKLGNTIAPGNMGIAILPKLSRAISPYSRYPRKYSLNQGGIASAFCSPCSPVRASAHARNCWRSKNAPMDRCAWKSNSVSKWKAATSRGSPA